AGDDLDGQLLGATPCPPERGDPAFAPNDRRLVPADAPIDHVPTDHACHANRPPATGPGQVQPTGRMCHPSEQNYETRPITHAYRMVKLLASVECHGPVRNAW